MEALEFFVRDRVALDYVELKAFLSLYECLSLGSMAPSHGRVFISVLCSTWKRIQEERYVSKMVELQVI